MRFFRRFPVLSYPSILFLAALVPACLGCSSGTSTSAGSKEASPPEKVSAVFAPKDGEESQVVRLDFALPNALGGGNVDLGRFDGTIRVVDFWATWCPPCRTAIPWLNKLHRTYKDRGVSIVGVSVDENPKALAGFDQEVHIEYASLLSSEQAEKAFGGIFGLPTTFVLDRQGKVYRSYVGEVDHDELEADIQALLAVR